MYKKSFFLWGIFSFALSIFVFSSVPLNAAVFDVTNAEKLSLPTSTPIGTKVRVSDGFVVSGGEGDADGLYGLNGIWVQYNNANSKPEYYLFGNPEGGAGSDFDCNWDGTQWVINTNNGGLFTSSDDVAFPWLVTDWIPAYDGLGNITLTYPVIEELKAASTTQGGVFVSGGTQDGIYTDRGTQDGKRFYNLLNQSDDYTVSSVVWSNANSQWEIKDSGGDVLYYSSSSVAAPDLAHNWMQPGSNFDGLTVSGATLYPLVNLNYSERVPYNGKPRYKQLDTAENAKSPEIFWNSASVIPRQFNNLPYWSIDNDYWSNEDVAYPWLVVTWHYGFNSSSTESSLNVTQQTATPPAPASIAITNVTQGELDAGVNVSGAGTSESNQSYAIASAGPSPNGKRLSYRGTVLANSITYTDDIGDGGFAISNAGQDSYYYSKNNQSFPFPWQVTFSIELGDIGTSPLPTVTRNDVASEANWILSTEDEESTSTPPALITVAPQTAIGGSLGPSTTSNPQAPTPEVPGCPPGYSCTPLPPPNCPPGFVCTPNSSPNNVVSPLSNDSSISTITTHDLTLGGRGEDVRQLQFFLNTLGYLLASTGPGSPGEETTTFGPLTKAALAKFQAANNIKPSVGYFGPQTRDFIEKLKP